MSQTILFYDFYHQATTSSQIAALRFTSSMDIALFKEVISMNPFESGMYYFSLYLLKKIKAKDIRSINGGIEAITSIASEKC